jgi:hypothetical protein
MHKATKAALISALIFPGGGHFYLKSKLRGTVFTFFSAGCLYVLITDLISIADDISDNMASLLLLGCWAIAIIDSIIVGRKLTVPTTVNDKVVK